MSLRAVVTAGGRVSGDLAAAMGTSVKALAPVRGTAMIDTVLDAIAGAGVDDAAVIAPDEVRTHVVERDIRVLDAAANGGTNVLRALGAWPGEDLLYCTSDLPYLTSAGLRAFIDAARESDVAMALATPAAYGSRFPGAPLHTVALADATIVNGSVFLIRAEATAAVARLATAFFAARKSLWRMALLLGPPLAWRFATRRLTVAALESEAHDRLAGARALAVRDADPGLCFDVDSLDDYRYACRVP